VYTFAQLLFDDTAALVARLRRVFWVNRDDLDPGPDGLVVEQITEYPDAYVVGGPGKAAVSEHEVEVEVFERDHAVGFDEPRRHLMPPIAALTGYALLLALYLTNGLPPAAASLPAAGDRALQYAQLAERLFEVAQAVDERAVTQGEGVVNTHVDAHRRAFVRLRLRVGKLDLQQDVPPGRLSLQDDVLELGPIGKLPMPPHGDEAHVLQIQLPALEVRPVAGLEVHAVKAVGAFEAGLAALPFEELAERTVEPPEHLLPGAHVEHPQRVFIGLLVAPIPPHRRLLIVGGRVPALAPPLAAVVERPVVQPTANPQHVAHHGFLLGGRVQAVLVGQDHLAPLLPFDVALDRLDGNMPGGPGVVAACPQGRQAAVQFGELLPQLVARAPLDAKHDLVDRYRGGKRDQQMNVIGHHGQIEHFPAVLLDDWRNKLGKPFSDLAFEYGATKLRTPHEVVIYLIRSVAGSFSIHKRIMPCFSGDAKRVSALRAARIPLPPKGGSTLRGFLWIGFAI